MIAELKKLSPKGSAETKAAVAELEKQLRDIQQKKDKLKRQREKLKRQADLISDRSYNPTSDEVDKLLKAINELQGAIDATDDQANETELKAAEEFQKLKDHIAAASEKSRLDDELQVVAEALGEEMQRFEDILKEFPAEANNLLQICILMQEDAGTDDGDYWAKKDEIDEHVRILTLEVENFQLL